MKINDVYRLNWKEREWNDQKNHCFQGLAIVKEVRGELMYMDTYWGYSLNGGSNLFTEEKATKLFNIEFYFNLDDVEKIGESDLNYYDDDDVVRLSNQHSCSRSCIDYFVKKGSKKSKKKLLSVIELSLEDEKRNIDYCKNRIERLEKTKIEVQQGNLEVYI